MRYEYTIAYREGEIFYFGWSTDNLQYAVQFARFQADYYPEVRIIKKNREIAMVLKLGSTEIYDQAIIREFALANAI